MKRSEIEVGKVYGVRLSVGADATVVPAQVMALDDPYPHKIGRWGQETQTARNGGIRVRFVQPTRVGYNGFSLAAQTNDNAGPIAAEYVFGDRRNGGAVGKCFVGLWSELEARRKANEKRERDAKAQAHQQADAFAPALVAYVARLRRVGLPVEAYDDGSGLHGPVAVELRKTSYAQGSRPYAFGYEARLPVAIFDQLVEIAERHGEKVKVER